MFENIIGYTTRTAHWKHLIKEHAFPSSLCIVASKNSGKSSCAIEIARSLLCENEGAWGCFCFNCLYTRLLEHESVVIIGNRDFMQEIQCATHMMLSHWDMQSCLFFYRAIMKLLRRADEILWEETSVWKSLKTAVGSLRESLVKYQEYCILHTRKSDKPSASDFHIMPAKTTKTERELRSIVKNAEKLYAALPAYLYPVQVIRNITAWTHIIGHNVKKIVILENSEDMQESSANALLKTLEEPPENTYFIFTTSKVSSLPRTIVSRLQVETLPIRSYEEEQEVMQKVFRNTEASVSRQTISDFLFRFTEDENEGDNALEVCAEKYFHAAIKGAPFKEKYIEFLKRSKAKNIVKAFIEVLQKLLHAILLNTDVHPRIVQDLFHQCSSTVRNTHVLHISPQVALENLYYSLMKKMKWYNYEKFFTHNTQ